MAKLTRLKIEAFRNVEPVELRFGGGFNVLLGLNATGKTTLLDLIAAILSDDFYGLREETFSIEYDLAIEGAELTAFVKSEPKRLFESAGSDEPLMLRTEIAGAEPNWSAEVRLTIGQAEAKYAALADPRGVIIRREDSPAQRTAAPVSLWRRVIRHMLIHVGEMELERLTGHPPRAQLHDFISHLLNRFDESLDFFRLIVHGSEQNGGRPAKAPLIRFSREREHTATVFLVSTGGSLLPREIWQVAVKRLSKQAASGEPQESLSLRTDALDFLRRVTDVLGFKNCELQIRLLEKKVEATTESWSFGDFRFMFERADGSIVSHDRLSYGQKRLLAFFYYLAVNPRTVIADELVDGLHHRWIQECIEAIDDRQAFLASQNPLLFDYLEFESPAEVRSSFTLCRLEMREGAERMLWSNMTEYEADRFFEAYKVGIQHVSEILVDKGLW
jgi:energy-coupling factor transporter ATP-binding protein EcfA2